MSVLYVRNVPEETLTKLRELAKARHISVQALALSELNATARRANNAALLSALPDNDISIDAITDTIDQERRNR